MATVTINITRTAVYSIAEGISITISQHNGGTPTFEQLWASTSESKKLDIYYREAIGDLERRLMDWVTSVSGQFDLTASGTDYTISITMNRFWPTRLEGLLKNKVQDFLVHAVTAGWLNDFEGLQVKSDYLAMSMADLTDIREIIHQRSFSFTESERADDGDDKDDSGTPTAAGRHDDGDKDAFSMQREAGARRKDNVRKEGENDRPPLAGDNTQRHRDNAIVDTRGDWTDMSGTGIAYRDRPPRPIDCPPEVYPLIQKGVIIKHNPPRPCLPPKPAPVPPPLPDPIVYPEVPTHAIPKKYPTGKKPPLPNGKGWSDDDKYNMEGEERFINKHDCGHHDCEVSEEELDWDFDK